MSPQPPRQPPSRPPLRTGQHPLAPQAPQAPQPPPRRSSQTPPPADVITKQTLVGAVVLTALVTTMVAALLVSLVLERGREGSRGQQGSTGETGKDGPRGPRGRTNRDVNTAALVKAIMADPAAFANAATEAQGGLPDDEPDPLDDSGGDVTALEDDLTELRDQVQILCDTLRSSTDVNTEDLPC